MADSKRWAQEKLEQANAISEPGDRPLRIQLLYLTVWTAEVLAVWWLASWFWSS